ncbi:MAG: type II secretion system minor pseudopilin GspK [Deltaproteobacteria bacterium]|nr:type II secretion system minor pseudopilin GspK [Deltaproteobacteria bacterium]
MPKPSRLKNQKGFALVLTLLMISMMVVVTLQFNRSVWSGLYGSSNLKENTRLRLVARSGFECAVMVLSEDKEQNDVDTLREPWAQSRELSLQSTALFEKGYFMVEISDLCSKIQINRLLDSKGDWRPAQRDLFQRFLLSKAFGLDSDAVSNLMDFIKDWLDPDEDITRFGAESGYYQGLDPPYACGNSPLGSLDRLALIRGISGELLYGTSEKKGIMPYLSVHGDGKININTAGPVVLQALSTEMDEDMVQDMIAYREDTENDLADPKWYQKVRGMDHIVFDTGLLTTQSDYFEIQSTGAMGKMEQQLNISVFREPGKPIQILQWKADPEDTN